jgi:hypothetical protein
MSVAKLFFKILTMDVLSLSFYFLYYSGVFAARVIDEKSYKYLYVKGGSIKYLHLLDLFCRYIF